MTEQETPRKQEQQEAQEDDTSRGAQPAPSSSPAPAVQQMSAGLEDVLDDIESVLEENAHDYVSHFVQKGGQ